MNKKPSRKHNIQNCKVLQEMSQSMTYFTSPKSSPHPFIVAISNAEIGILSHILLLISACPQSSQLRYGLLGSWLYVVHIFEKLLFHNPEAEVWRQDYEKEALGMDFGWQKLQWASALCISPREVGWNFGLQRLQHAPKMSRKRFIANQLRYFCRVFIIMDAASMVQDRWKYPDVFDHPSLLDRLLVSIDSFVIMFCSWETQWTFVSLVDVIGGLSEPEDWPPIHGTFDDMTSVGRFWCSFWQQILHQSLLGYSRALIAFLVSPDVAMQHI
ncbi:hypothetical protein P152DRAFT_136617 [Eremomyces bilateralis CBS 781.70]|uniref:Uncharacterized protein n=1 Tax=Eremomyces bilateralis CBS 781.70 TaxID=1392243 RepID=A0A6G1GFX5_9PEZI|nr:uncharacterized protein P152DRAFT_136617 [Eremomyces bilateralis CBS 781.70]KAF1816760.1 hypothetical protein P152DRAFT_136617 [Eremomyces bilateralis CBS 781.70]